ncbi:hypothetical protein A2331_03055 [Candidatus Falkowbacteria bacterium RIFOXYB2_FULL_34_18]|uniref:Nudix hydrolase domain-containing protein n=1 Tax=Candidatus Falkowbacteria bacterium RIFOXYD2_FULL_34_120 TaxID=1798007 RepID=A0A1F5TME8_9BACT|nr:MAG: hypothetical protein A2331_03055 [Candidatus Falkowbacteria bacterium RIFOXYB2_FULL_34_18]OGF28313.1 MAG: hypothetical protein A2500_02885 [Candidatus Falkowbacteria bacterium RIFOXYC12_FULL_34_55]OGF37968.1 MAG: hypothetical protein A2466_06200 [Candidatus Falkowbacteria bacterium RIFOXYC2_FULL_34_220]OGF39686.1 MAG: hypothetical protein A2515_07495 [Candidatus Falkowbacteria bacterium RIFOXYD12_FULL_34_57]OGF40125.1 MAG: hypothetical protein A2531_05190 [Candidatus Falkowbacteria bact
MNFKKTNLYNGKFLRVIGKEFQTKTGKDCLWECVERSNVRGIVAVFAVTKKEKEVVLTKQYRIPHEGCVVETPAGLVDKDGENFTDTAKRELQEETGYSADKFIYVHGGPFNAGMSDCVMDIYYAPDAEYVGFEGVESDDAEDIEVIKIPLKDLVDFCVKKHDDFTVDIKILGTLKILEYKGLL